MSIDFVGIGIDYTLHLALGYVETSRELPAAEQARMAVTHVGVSIISGAGSTAASGLLLFFSVITFFKLFGYFIFATALLSMLLHSLLQPCSSLRDRQQTFAISSVD